MNAPVPGSTRRVTIDRTRRAQLVRGLMLSLVVSRPAARRMLTLLFGGLVIAWLAESWPIGGALAVVAVVGQLVVWRIRLQRSLKRGLGVGQTVWTGYTDSGDLTVTDATGQIWLGRGSAMAVYRRRDHVVVLGRTVSFVLPTELLTDADIDFLEGHGEPATEHTTPAPDLPLALEMSPGIQAQLVSSATRVRATSADFLVPYLSAPMVIGFGVLTRSGPFIAGTVVFGAVCLMPTLRWLGAARKAVRQQYPVGATIRAQVTPEHLVLHVPHRTLMQPLSEYHSRRLTTHTVLLRRDRRRSETTQVLPRALFPESALADLAAGVPRLF